MTNETVASGRLLRPVDAASLAVFRIVFGVAVAIDAWRYLAYGWVREYYIAPAIHFPHVDVAWLRPWPGEGMIFHYVAISVLALSVAAGLWYRTTSLLLALAYGWAFLLEKSVYMNHHYLMVLLAFLLAVLPAQRALSVDVWRGVIARAQVPFLAVALLRFQLAIVYLYGAVAKLNPDWLAGEPMLSSLRDGGPEIPSLAHLLPAELLATFIAWAGIAVDVAIPVLLLRRSTVGWGIALAVAFHALNGVFLRIGVFSWLMIGAVTIFLPPDWPRRWLGSVGRVGEALPPRRWWIACAAVYVFVQLVVPLRHWAYPGDVNWTEEGHRFSWRMKLRSKDSILTIHARDPATGRRWSIDPSADLVPRQVAKLQVFPDILLQFVHAHRDRLRAAGVDAEIHVDWWCSLNGAPPQRLVDPTVDLAAEESGWRAARWILPYDRAGGRGAS